MESGQGTPRDTDMASPPSSFRSPVGTTTLASASTTIQPDPVAAIDSTAQDRRSSKQKQRVPDGYIYQAYYDPSRSRRHLQEQQQDSNPSSIGGTSRNNQASATRILELRGLERRIVQLLETAGEAIQILSGEDDEDEDNKNQTLDQAALLQRKDQKVAQFNALASSYMTLVNEIQGGMRRQFHYLTKAGITSSQVPFKNVVYGEEKELETWLNAVDVLKESTGHLVANIGSELQDSNEKERSTSQE